MLSSGRFDKQRECGRTEYLDRPPEGKYNNNKNLRPFKQNNILRLFTILGTRMIYVVVPPHTVVVAARIHSKAPCVVLLQIGPATRSFFRTSFRTPAGIQGMFGQATDQ